MQKNLLFSNFPLKAKYFVCLYNYIIFDRDFAAHWKGLQIYKPLSWK